MIATQTIFLAKNKSKFTKGPKMFLKKKLSWSLKTHFYVNTGDKNIFVKSDHPTHFDLEKVVLGRFNQIHHLTDH